VLEYLRKKTCPRADIFSDVLGYLDAGAKFGEKEKGKSWP